MASDLILVVGSVVGQLTGDTIVIEAGRIVAVVAESDAKSYAGPQTRWIRQPNAVAIPGLVDSHAHITGLGQALERLDLRGTTSIEQIAEMVKTVKGDGWIMGRGWDQTHWAHAEFPTHTPLASPRPVSLRRIDGHAVWANQVAMDLAGVGLETPDPAGGQILRDSVGQPTGVFLDTAMDLIESQIPPPSDAELRRWIISAVKVCHAVGLTGVHDAGTSAASLRVMHQLAAEGGLGLRIYAMLDGSDPANEAALKSGPSRDNWVDVNAVKLFADGALGSRGAWLREPYSDAPETSGIPIVHGAVLKQRVQAYAAAGFQVGVHGIGDAAVGDVLDAYQAVLSPKNNRRFRIEHAQIVTPSDQERMATLGVLAMVQPTHATSDMAWAEDRLGPERIRYAYGWRSLLTAGVRLSLGSDFPIEQPPPLSGLFAAVNRTDKAGWPAGGWYPDEALTVAEALRGFTVDTAFASFSETHRGQIAAGFDADLTLLSDDPLQVPPTALRDITVIGVIVGGQVHGNL